MAVTDAFFVVAVPVDDILPFWRKRKSDLGPEDFDVRVDAGELVTEEVLRLSAMDDAVIKDVDEELPWSLR